MEARNVFTSSSENSLNWNLTSFALLKMFVIFCIIWFSSSLGFASPVRVHDNPKLSKCMMLCSSSGVAVGVS